MVCQFPVPSIPLLCSKDIFCCDSAKLKLMLGSRIFTRFLNVPLLRLRTLTLRCPTVHGARQRRLYRALAAFDCGWRYCCGGCGPAARVCLKLWPSMDLLLLNSFTPRHPTTQFIHKNSVSFKNCCAWFIFLIWGTHLLKSKIREYHAPFDGQAHQGFTNVMINLILFSFSMHCEFVHFGVRKSILIVFHLLELACFVARPIATWFSK